MRIMTTIYLDDAQIAYFRANKNISMSHVIRQQLDKYIITQQKTRGKKVTIKELPVDKVVTADKEEIKK